MDYPFRDSLSIIHTRLKYPIQRFFLYFFKSNREFHHLFIKLMKAHINLPDKKIYIRPLFFHLAQIFPPLKKFKITKFFPPPLFEIFFISKNVKTSIKYLVFLECISSSNFIVFEISFVSKRRRRKKKRMSRFSHSNPSRIILRDLKMRIKAEYKGRGGKKEEKKGGGEGKRREYSKITAVGVYRVYTLTDRFTYVLSAFITPVNTRRGCSCG